MFSETIKQKLSALKSQTVGLCETCGGEGYLPLKKHPGRLKRCECMIVFKYLMELTISNIPQDYWDLTLAKMQIADEYKRVIKNYLAHLKNAIAQGLGLVLTGPNGIGKTSIMCYVGCRAIVHNYQVRYFTLSQFITATQKNNQQFIDHINEAQLLLIDELDKKYSKKGSDYVVKTFDEHLRGWFSDGKTVILCTNWTTADLQQNFGESLVSLMKRRCDFLEMVGDDFSDYIQAAYWERLRHQKDLVTECITKQAYEREAKK